ncbi:hypothetical protein ACFL15_01200 [Patescibacteria group bacterium]
MIKENTKEILIKDKKNKLLIWSIIIFFITLVSRIFVLIYVTLPGNGAIGDVYHHWQIAYLSKTIGFKNGFLRLWDFKGMEYYWGLLHPLILIIGFIISGSISVLVAQVISILFASLNAVLVFLIIERYFNKNAAFFASMFFALIPTALFHDTLGLQESMGLFFLIWGIYLYSKRALASGFIWMLAGMIRAEFWIFGFALVVASILGKKKTDHKILTAIGYAIPGLIYMKYLLNWTQNPIYPVYWNFLVIGLGKWGGVRSALDPRVESIRMLCRVFTIVPAAITFYILYKKPKFYLFYFFGFLYFTFICFLFGFSNHFQAVTYYYLNKYTWYEIVGDILVGKIFIFVEAFAGLLLSIFFLYFLPKKLGKVAAVIGSIIIIAILASSQYLWLPIKQHYQISGEVDAAQTTASVIAGRYSKGGKVILPSGSPNLTYFLAYNEKIPGEKMISSFYNPLYYYEGDKPFDDWGNLRQEFYNWLQKNNAELFVVTLAELKDREGNPTDLGKIFILEDKVLFNLLDELEGYRIYEVIL